MSRAFTKEDDAGEDLPERPVSSLPNYVTPRGLQMLKEEVLRLADEKQKAVSQGADVKTFERDLRYLEARINSAIVVPAGQGDEVRFGAHVTVEDEHGASRSFQIVGEDEARTDNAHLIAWSAPLVDAIFGARPGETATVETEQGQQKLKVIDVRYETT